MKYLITGLKSWFALAMLGGWISANAMSAIGMYSVFRDFDNVEAVAHKFGMVFFAFLIVGFWLVMNAMFFWAFDSVSWKWILGKEGE